MDYVFTLAVFLKVKSMIWLCFMNLKMLQDLQQSSIDTNSNILCICEDPAYTANLNTDQRAWNGAMSSVKVSVEWLFGDIKNF